MDYQNIKTKIRIVLLVGGILSFILSVLALIYTYHNKVIDKAASDAESIVALCSSYINSKDLTSILNQFQVYDGYATAETYFEEIKANNEEIEVLRVYSIDNRDTLNCLFDIYTDEEKASEYVYEYKLGDKVYRSDPGMKNIFEMYDLGITDKTVEINKSDKEYMYAYSILHSGEEDVYIVLELGIELKEYKDDIIAFCGVVILGIFTAHMFCYLIQLYLIRFFFEKSLSSVNDKVNNVFYKKGNYNLFEKIEILAEETDEKNKQIQNLKEENEKITSEMDLATHMRLDLMPHIVPVFPEFANIELASKLEMSKDDGGSFYDFFMLDDERIALVSASVDGGGVPVGLFMIIAKTLIKNHLQSKLSPQDVLDVTNNQLCENNNAALFVSAWVGVFNVKTGLLQYSSASHPSPIFVDESGAKEKLEDSENNMPIGVWEDIPFKNYETYISKGSTVVVFGPGVVAAENINKERYSDEDIYNVVLDSSGNSADYLITRMMEDWIDFQGDNTVKNDFSVIIFKI